MFKLALKPRWIAFLLLILTLVSGFVMLSRWQLTASTLGQVRADPAKEVVRPLEEVVHLHQPLTTTEADTMVEASGTYVVGSSYLVENKLHGGERGYWIVSEFLPYNGDTSTTSVGEQQVGIAVARAWTSIPEIPAEPAGEVTVAGRIVANDAPSYSKDTETDNTRVLGSAAAAQLTNLWDAPLYSAILTADAEVEAGQRLPLTAAGTLEEGTTVINQNQTMRPVEAEQVTDEQVNWLNIFYALEWLVFAGFALYLWWRMLKDSYEKNLDPAQYFEYEGEYWLDEETGRYYYWDPKDRQYYFFDDLPDRR